MLEKVVFKLPTFALRPALELLSAYRFWQVMRKCKSDPFIDAAASAAYMVLNRAAGKAKTVRTFDTEARTSFVFTRPTQEGGEP